METTITTDLSKFGSRERDLLIELLTAWQEHGLPDDFDDDEVVPTFNMNSGYVFLTNANYEVAMMNGDTLESWYSCPQCGHEGFKEDMGHEGNTDCQEYLAAISQGVTQS